MHKRSSNFAVFSEFDRYPLQISILLSTLLFWYRLKKTYTESLSDAFASSKKLHENGFHSCFSSFRSIFSSLDIPYANNELNFLNLNNFKKSIKRIVLTRYKEF